MKYAPMSLIWGDEHIPAGDLRAQSISDAVVISTAINKHGLLLLCRAVSSMALELLAEGFFIRGAIVKDRLFHDEKTVFGEALVRAYVLESQVVRYPRVMITREVVSDMNEYDNGKIMELERPKHIFRQADDGPVFLHVLQSIQEFIGASMRNEGLDDSGALPIVEYYASLGQHIQNRFNEAADNPKHFEKVQWFARYWNHEIADIAESGFERIAGPGLDKKQRTYWSR
jgi:hypothetical protein